MTTSNIRVFVTFKDSTVFAGEEVEATITFKNVQPARVKPQRPTLSVNPSSTHGSKTHSRATSLAPSRPPLSRQPSANATLPRRPPPLSNPRHRPTASLNIVDSEPNSYPPRSAKSATTGIHIAEPSPGLQQNHNRSVSIISIGSDTNSVDRRNWTGHSTPRASRPGFKHARSASLQISPGGNARSPSLNGRTQPSPLSSVASPRFRSAESYFSRRESYKGNDSIPASPLGATPTDFQFPPGTRKPLPQRGNTFAGFTPTSSRPSSVALPSKMSAASRQYRESSTLDVNPANRVASLASADLTPRTSSDIYSISNLSDETLVSEYPLQGSDRFQSLSILSRSSSTRQASRPNVPEDLMMGYVQLTGNFTIDGSLVNQSPFEEVKRKAIVGGQGGGGVVGIERPKTEGGLFGGFGWSSIGESLGGLLGSGQQSTIKEMKEAATSKNIPIISTPKSILFVDMKLNPGESRSFNYRIKLPNSLPPSHKGRAMKVVYQLVVGLQRPSSARGQDIKTIDIPFRVFSGMTLDGELLGHDLLSPYIILRDEAQTSAVDAFATTSRLRNKQPLPPSRRPSHIARGERDFSSYIDHLLSAPRHPETNTLLSPTADPEDLVPTSPVGDHEQPPTSAPPVRTIIDHAIRLASSAASGEPTAFNIARAGRPIATLTISRPAVRLGDTLHLMLSFTDAHIPCYALDATLESVESVDPSLSIRSAASVDRVTRRVWDRVTEPGFSLGWCGRWSGRLKVPWAATPGFLTSGVSCKWIVRMDIVVGVEPGTRFPEPVAEDDDDPEGEEDTLSDSASFSTAMSQAEQALALPQSQAPVRPPSRRSATSSRPRRSKQLQRPKLDRSRMLLEDIGADERGRHLAPKQRLLCESFEVAVPIRVFGAPGGALGEEFGGRGLPI